MTATETPNTVDALMDLDPLSLTADNIDQIIAYHRKARAASTGGKARKDTGPKINISEVMKNLGGAPAVPVGIVRRR